MRNSAFQLLIACLLVSGGSLMGWWWANQQHAMHPQASTEQVPAGNAAPKAAREILYWYDPMMPQQHFDHPGKSPFMDMQLVAKYADADTPAGLKIAPQIAENIGVRLTTVSKLPLSKQIEVSGLIAFNEHDVAIVQTLSNGFVTRVWPLAVGDLVKAGQPLAEIVQPEWVAAQQEFLAVQQLTDSSLQSAAKERMQLLGMPPALIKQLQHTGKVQNQYTLTAPLAGVIQSIELRNGMSVNTGQTVVRLNGLSTVWLEAAVPEQQAGDIHPDDVVQIQLTAFPAEQLTGRVAGIIPMLNDSSRSVKVRVALKNPQQRLWPGQTAQVKFSTAIATEVLAVPTEAVIRTGKRSLVMLAYGGGRYQPHEISLGDEIGEQTIVTAGLAAGDKIVASGQFLLDSEASLNGITTQKLPVTTEDMP